MQLQAPPPPLAIPARGGRATTTVYWALAGVIALGVAVRFPTLGEQSFWLDESYTHGIVAHGLGHVLSAVPRTESTPPLYYVLLWLWSRVFGIGEAGLRSLSALSGTLTIPVVWLLGRRLISERVGLIAALLTAVSPLLFWYSQEARAYSLLTLLSALSLLALLRALEMPSRARLLQWSGVCVLAFATHYFAAIVIAPEAVWLLAVLHRRRLISVPELAIAFGPIAAVALALLPLMSRQNDGRASFLSSHGSLSLRLAQLAKQDLIAYDQPDKIALSAIAVIIAIAALSVLVLRGTQAERRATLLPFTIGIGGVGLTVLVAAAGPNYIDTRNLLPTWPALVLPVAAGFGAARGGLIMRAALAAYVALCIGCVVGVIANPLYQRQDWRGAARALGPAGGARAIVTPGEGPEALPPYLEHYVLYPGSGAGITEVDVIGLYRRPPGTHDNLPPLRPRNPATLPGFRLAEIRETASYTVLRYRAGAAVTENPAALLGLALDPRYTVLLQNR